MRARWSGVLLAAAIGCGSDDSGTGFAGSYQVMEQRDDETCNGEGISIDIDPALEFLELADVGATIEWRPCAADGDCAAGGDPVGDYPRHFDEETAEGWRGSLDASEDVGTVCNYYFYQITLVAQPTDLQPDQIALAERELRETRSMDECTRPDDVTVDSAGCLEQRIFLAVPAD